MQNSKSLNDLKKPEDNKDHTDDEDDDAVDPFVHSLSLTTAEWAQTLLLGIILVPIRLVLILFFMLLMWIISSVSLRVVSRGKYKNHYEYIDFSKSLFHHSDVYFMTHSLL